MWYNSIMAWLLRSPFHGLLDKGLMLVTISGRKSGKKYSTPVNYLQDGNTLWVTSLRARTWWRNLKGGAPLSVYLAGMQRTARGDVIEDQQAVAESLAAYFQKAPQLARYFKVGIDAAGQADRADCARAAQERVVVRIDLV